ncbi:MAG: two-component system, OmpR family, phosphate regulon sensor histidine kinase PhoR, partial [Acidimicrobiaceae bacterium]|nr:two-component system, OmpR family, phosphate regulon sensor histidine kinase PhoR [Acidimicrobiaceae bacterium]
SRDLGPATELQPVLATVLDAMRSLVDFRGGTVCLVDEGRIRVAAADPPVSDDVLAARLPVGKGLVGLTVASGTSQYSPDLDDDPRVDPALRRLGTNASMRSYLTVPLVCLGWIIGVLEVDSEEVDAFDEDDLAVLEGLATQVAGAIESARRYEQVVELERLKTDFLGRVSHELRTPLTIISGFTTTLMAYDDRLTGEQRRDMLERVGIAASRLEGLIDEVLTVTGFEAGVIAPTPTDLAIVDVLAEVAADVADRGPVAVEGPDDLRWFVDGRLLHHALRLLVDNALKYGESATIRARIDAEDALVIDVADTGPGVPPALREQIFERFTRGDDSQPGMGLGLPLVRMLASGLDATVTVDDNPGGGAVFRLLFGRDRAGAHQKGAGGGGRQATSSTDTSGTA